jgi:hypothetical protein
MELKQFIKEALLNIVDGVEDANKTHNRFKIFGVKHESGVDGIYADFDVSVIVNEASSGGVKGKIGVSLLNVVSAGVGSKIDQTNLHQNTHRLTFRVFISEKILN